MPLPYSSTQPTEPHRTGPSLSIYPPSPKRNPHSTATTVTKHLKGTTNKLARSQTFQFYNPIAVFQPDGWSVCKRQICLRALRGALFFFFFFFVLVPGRAVDGATGGFRVRYGMMALHRRIRDWTGYGGWYLRIGG